MCLLLDIARSIRELPRPFFSTLHPMTGLYRDAKTTGLASVRTLKRAFSAPELPTERARAVPGQVKLLPLPHPAFLLKALLKETFCTQFSFQNLFSGNSVEDNGPG